MGESELKTALQREGAERISALWQDVETRVSARRGQNADELARLREESDRQLQAQVAQLRSNLLFAVRTKVLERRLHTEAALEKRLWELADKLLPELAAVHRAETWQALSAELPAADWTAIAVHPADRQQAERAFPDAVVTCDEMLGGGLVATSADASLRVDNSLACRLRRCWPELLPQLLAELRKLVDDNETARTDKTG